MSRLVLGSIAALGVTASAMAQVGNEWVEYIRTDSMLDPSATAISNSSTEVDFDFADLDKDGWTDLVVVRKEPVTTAGKRTNLLLMNENGVLVDRTAQYATASLSAGDSGFNTPTNDRDVVIVDLDNDTWLDLVTATTLSDGDSKRIGHPRVYMNLGNDGGGNWLGFRHEDARIPQMFVNGNPANPRFCSVAAGDVTGDGFADLYFGDYDSGPQPHADYNDRLLVNDGNGFFTDESNARMTNDMLDSAFGMASGIHDFNLDGVNDVIRDSALNAPQNVQICYNDPDNEGVFDIRHVIHTDQPYHVNWGDLNNDGRPDAVFTDDASDRYRFNRSTDVFGRAVWSPARTFSFAGGGNDDGFGGNNYIVDLDHDGWNDIIITDVDVDIAGCDRRTHIYHNPGGAVGSEPQLVEEREFVGGGNGWLGVVGMRASDLRGTHDIAVFDIDRDGGVDMVVGRCTGTFAWRQDYDAPPGGGPGDLGGSTGTTSPPRRSTKGTVTRINVR